MRTTHLAETLAGLPPIDPIAVAAVGSSRQDFYSPCISPTHVGGEKDDASDDTSWYLQWLHREGVPTHHGGDGANGAAGLSGEGVDVTFVGVAGEPGQDAEQMVRRDLRALGIKDGRAPGDHVPASVIERIWLPDKGSYTDRYVIREPGDMVDALTEAHLLEQLTGKTAVLIASLKSDKLLERVLRVTNELGTKFVAFNPGATAFKGNEAQRKTLLKRIQSARIGAMALNVGELRQFYGEAQTAPVQPLLTKLVRHVGLLLCSDGKDGAYLAHTKEYIDDTDINLGDILTDLQMHEADEGTLSVCGLIRSTVRTIAAQDRIDVSRLVLPHAKISDDSTVIHQYGSIKLRPDEMIKDTLGAGDAMFSNFVRYYLLLTRAFAGSPEALGQAHVIAMSLAMYQGTEAIKYVGAHAYRHHQRGTELTAA